MFLGLRKRTGGLENPAAELAGAGTLATPSRVSSSPIAARACLIGATWQMALKCEPCAVTSQTPTV
jgi:hypothetical protein